MSQKIVTKDNGTNAEIAGRFTMSGSDGYIAPYSTKERSIIETGVSRTFGYLDYGKTIIFDNASPCEYIIPYQNSSLIENGGFVRIIQRGAGTVSVKSNSPWVFINDIQKPTGNSPGQYKEIVLRCLDKGVNWIYTGSVTFTPQALADEVQLTISGMTGSNWNGLGNGVHSLDGVEGASSTNHSWRSHPSDNPDRLELNASVTTSTNGTTTYTYYYSSWRMYYGGASSYYYWTSLASLTTGGAPSIANRLFTSCTINGVTFTWAKGSAWSRGNM